MTWGICGWPFCDEEISETDIAFYVNDCDGTSFGWDFGVPAGIYFTRPGGLWVENPQPDPQPAPAWPIYFMVVASHEVAHAGDFNEDGLQDLYVSNLGSNELYLGSAAGLFTEAAEDLGIAVPWWATRRCIRVRLEGVRSNREGRGAQVVVFTETGRTLRRAMGSGGVVQASGASELHFGLGQDRASRIEVLWPSGTVTVVGDVQQRSLVWVREHL